MRRSLLVVLIGSIVLNAALGIYALVGGDFGELEQNILLTSLAISAAGVLALACLPASERGSLGPLPRVGMTAAAAAAAAFVVVIWLHDAPEALERTAGTLAVVAVTAAFGSVVGLASLAPRFRWVSSAALGLALVLGALVLVIVWGEGDKTWFGRTVGVVAVLLAAFTLLVPILHRASRSIVVAPAGGYGVRHCPSCGRRVAAEAGVAASCPACGSRFTVSLDPAGDDP